MNPFIQNIKLKVLTKTDSYHELRQVDNSDGAEGKVRKVQESYLVEAQQKASVYDRKDIDLILYTHVKSNGRDMFLYIVYHIKKDQDWIDLHPKKVCQEMGITRTTYYSALKQMIGIGIICKKEVTTYWINPIHLFKGNRINFYRKVCPECIDVVTPKRKK